MSLIDCLSPERTRLSAQAKSKKRALEQIAEIIAEQEPNLNSLQIMESLFAREKLGTTALGCGVAIPHGRLAGCPRPIAVLLVLDDGIDYDAPDKEKVDILLGLLVPEDADKSHLANLSQCAKVMADAKTRTQMRNAHNEQALYEIVEQAWQRLCAPPQQK